MFSDLDEHHSFQTNLMGVSQIIKNTRPTRALSTEMWCNCTQIWNVDQEKYKPFPKFHCNPVWSCSGKSAENTWGEIWKSVRTNTNFSFPKFHCHSNTPSNFEAVFRHFVMNFSENKLLHINLTIRGRANQSFPASLVHFSLIWGRLKNLHRCGRGCRSRLSICQLNQNIYNKYWDGNAV